jgi:hypothetical protein
MTGWPIHGWRRASGGVWRGSRGGDAPPHQPFATKPSTPAARCTSRSAARWGPRSPAPRATACRSVPIGPAVAYGWRHDCVGYRSGRAHRRRAARAHHRRPLRQHDPGSSAAPTTAAVDTPPPAPTLVAARSPYSRVARSRPGIGGDTVDRATPEFAGVLRLEGRVDVGAERQAELGERRRAW